MTPGPQVKAQSKRIQPCSASSRVRPPTPKSLASRTDVDAVPPADPDDAFEAELTHILLHQMAAFNSPVWFNVGFEESPQCSACFILSVKDTME